MVTEAAAVLVETAVPTASNTAPTASVAAVTRSRWARFPEKSAIPRTAAAVKVATTANCELPTTWIPMRKLADMTSAVRPALRSERWSGS